MEKPTPDDVQAVIIELRELRLIPDATALALTKRVTTEMKSVRIDLLGRITAAYCEDKIKLEEAKRHVETLGFPPKEFAETVLRVRAKRRTGPRPR